MDILYFWGWKNAQKYVYFLANVSGNVRVRGVFGWLC